MATKLNTLTEAQLIERIDKAKAEAVEKGRLYGVKVRDRYLAKAEKLGRVLAEVRTTPFFFGGGSEPQPVTSTRADSGATAPDDDALPTEAGDKARPWAKGMRKLIWAWLHNHGPATTTEVCKGLGKMPWSVRPRFSELVSVGAIVSTNEKRSETGRGNSAVVWKAI